MVEKFFLELGHFRTIDGSFLASGLDPVSKAAGGSDLHSPQHMTLAECLNEALSLALRHLEVNPEATAVFGEEPRGDILPETFLGWMRDHFTDVIVRPFEVILVAADDSRKRNAVSTCPATSESWVDFLLRLLRIPAKIAAC